MADFHDFVKAARELGFEEMLVWTMPAVCITTLDQHGNIGRGGMTPALRVHLRHLDALDYQRWPLVWEGQTYDEVIHWLNVEVSHPAQTG